VRSGLLLDLLPVRLEDLLHLASHDAAADAPLHGAAEAGDLVGEGVARVDDNVPPWTGRKPATDCSPL
jgi:hypothetical protein